MGPSGNLLIVLTSGLEDGGRKAAIAFGVALSALATGVTVYLFLALESAVLGTPTGAGSTAPRGFSEPLREYIRHFSELGGKLEVCSSCFEEYCRELPKDERGLTALLPGTEIHSLNSIAERATQMPVLTF